jgi:hypothetical protein
VGFLGVFAGFLAGFCMGFLAALADYWQIFGTMQEYFIAHLVSFYRYARAKHS